MADMVLKEDLIIPKGTVFKDYYDPKHTHYIARNHEAAIDLGNDSFILVHLNL